MFPSNYVEYNDFLADADTKWFKLWSNALKPKFSAQQDSFWQTDQEKSVVTIGKLFAESLEVISS